MVLINRVKYSCERCIRGHRVSGCRHLDSTLKRIKRKGRPAVTCSLCKVKPKGARINCSHVTGGQTNKIKLEPEGSYANNANSFSSGSTESQHQVHEGYYYLSEFTMEQQLPDEVSPEDLESLKSDSRIVIELPDGTIVSGTRAQQQKLHSIFEQQPASSKTPSFSSTAPYFSNYNTMSQSNKVTKQSHSHSHSSSYNNLFGLNPGFGLPNPHPPTHPYMMHSSIRPSPSPVPTNFKYDEQALNNSMPHNFNHLNIITQPHTPQNQEELYTPPTSQPSQSFTLNGPYTAALYNDTMGNNAASAAINLNGTGNYATPHHIPSPVYTQQLHHQGYYLNPNYVSYPGDGGVAAQYRSTARHSSSSKASYAGTPRSSSASSGDVSNHNDLYSTNQELANSLPGIDQIHSQFPNNHSIDSQECKKIKIKKEIEQEAAYVAANSSIAQLSNLY